MSTGSILCAAALMLTIFYFSDVPYLHFISDASLPLWFKKIINASYIKIGESGFFSYAISIHPDFIIHKLGHFALYGLLGSSLYVATRRSLKWSMLIVMVFAISDEFHQGFVVGRSARLGDILLDVVSAMVFILLIRKLIHRGKIPRLLK